MIQDRFKEAGWYGYPVDIIIGGAGGIGSWVTLLASRLGYRTFVYDMDSIEEHNVGTQFYSRNDIGDIKVFAVKVNSENFGGTEINVFPKKYTELETKSSVMISSFDNMESRKIFYQNWKEYILSGQTDPKDVKIFIDGRMSAETGQIYFVKSKKDMELYESTLFLDSEVEDGPCSYKATPHNGPFIASMMISGLVSAVYNKSIGLNVREIPFEVSFRIPEFVIEVKSTKEYYDHLQKSL